MKLIILNYSILKSALVKKWVRGQFVAVSLVALLAGCGDGSSVADNGGIGGSGFTGGSGGGEVTGFGSVIFDDSTFEVNGSTSFTIDGVEVLGQSDLGVGMIATFELADDVSSDISAGTAQRIDAVTALKGVVTSISPLRVLGQAIFLTGDTVLDNVPGNAIGNLGIGDLVEVYGLTDDNDVVRATRIEYKTTSGLVEWKLTGIASNVSATTLEIGSQLVSINGVTIDDCAGGLMSGDFVEIKADPNAGFVAGNTLNMVTKVECQLRMIPIPSNPSGAVIPAQYEGVVTGYSGAGDFDFFIGEQFVEFSGVTEFRGGVLEDLMNGTRVEAEGQFDTVSLVLTASEIKFKQARVRIEAPVASTDVNAGVSLQILGLTVLGTAATEDDDNVLASASGLPAQVEVRGFIDGNGVIYAEEIRHRDSSDSSDIRLRGPVDNVSTPSLTILGVPVDISSASGYFDVLGNPLADINAFFALLRVGDIIEVEDAQLNAGPTITMDADSTVQFED